MQIRKSLFLTLTIMPATLLLLASPLLTSRVNAAPPKIDKIEPRVSVGGTPIVITGTDLDGVKSVIIGGVAMPPQLNTSSLVWANMPDLKPGCCMTLQVVLRFKDGTTVRSPVPVSYPVALMGVVGPLPYPPNGVFTVDSSWGNEGWTLPPPSQVSGSGFSSPVVGPGNLGIVTTHEDAPTFYIQAQFQQSGNLESSNPTAPVYGDHGWFFVALAMCEPESGTVPPADQRCKDWDGNIGTWKYITPAKQLILAEPPVGTYMSTGLITLPVGEKIFDERHLVRKLKFAFTIWESESSGSVPPNGVMDNLERTAVSSQELTVVRSPAAMAQLKVLPYTIVFQPPGDQSSATITLSRQYNTNFSLNNEADNATKSTTADSNQIKASASLAFGGSGASVGANFSSTKGWDNSTEYGFGTTTTEKGTDQVLSSFSSTWTTEAIDTLVPGSGATCASETNCATPIAKPNAYEAEPFWHDIFVLLIHPEFATWEQLAGKQLTVMIAAVPVVGTISVIDLAACADGIEAIPGIDQCALDYSDDNLVDRDGKRIDYKGKAKQVVLSKHEASNLLKLDPFFGRGQGADLDSNRAIKLDSATYGARVGNTPLQKTDSVTNTDTHEQDTGATTTYDASVTSVVETSTSFGFNLAVFLGDALSFDDTEKQTSETDTKIIYGDSTAVSRAKTTSAMVTLNDSDNVYSKNPKFHGPLPVQPSVNVFFDRKFGGFMYQDSAAPGPGSVKVKLRPMIVAELQHKEHGISRFTDVPNEIAAHDSIGVLARAHLLPEPEPGAATDSFKPASPITRADFAVMLTRAAGLPVNSSQTGFTDVTASDPRSKAIAAVVSNGDMAGATPTTFAPDAPLTSSVMAAALARAFNKPPQQPATAASTVDRATAAQAVLAALASK
jgi:S-layer homology domain